MCKWFKSALRSVVSAEYTGVEVTLGSIERRAEVTGVENRSHSGQPFGVTLWQR